MKYHLFNTLKMIVFVCFTILSTACFGQIDPFKKPDVVPLSPEAASLGRYGDIPVSEYTGIPNISIPLHVVKSGKLSLPINLDYHATGIGVTQESTWVGLGWNLIAGGAINYVAVGGNDRTSQAIATWENMKMMFDYISYGASMPDMGVSDRCNPTVNGVEGHIKDDAFWVASTGKGEPDIYAVNCLGLSFKFILHPKDGTPLLLGRTNKCKIIHQQMDEKFEITGEDGIHYVFSAKELIGNNPQAWYLSRVFDTEGNFIDLTYENYGYIYTSPTLSEWLISDHPIGEQNGFHREVKPSYILVRNLYLKEIRTNSETVYFNTDATRPDINGTGARRLTGIKVVDIASDTIVKQYSFQYDWFNGQQIGGNFLNDDDFNGSTTYIAPEYIKNRLKLTRVNRINPIDINSKAEVYSFDYNSVALPYKTSFAMDYWGYYNGEENTSTIMHDNAHHSILPSFNSMCMRFDMFKNIHNPVFWNYGGAQRGTSPNNITAGILQSITYPTRGKTVFEFEPHTFNNDFYYYSVDDEKRIAGIIDKTIYDLNNPTISKKEIYFTLTSATKVKLGVVIDGYGLFTYDQMKDAYVALANLGPNGIIHKYQISYSQFGQYGDRKIWDEYIDLEPGNYLLSCYCNGLVGGSIYAPSPVVQARLQYFSINQTLLNSCKKMGGGVRVKQISNYDSDNLLLSAEKYTYTGGKLLVPSDYIVQNSNVSMLEGLELQTNYNVFHLSSDNFYGQSISYIGNQVGYDKVEVEKIDNSNTNGKDISCFVNMTPTMFYNRPLYDYATNGDLLCHVYLNSIGDTLRKEQNTYYLGETYSEILNATARDNYVGGRGAYVGIVPDCETNKEVAVYPHKNFWSYLQKKVVTDYFNGGSNKVVNTTEYTYNPANYCPSQVKELGSIGTFKYTTFKYPSDYTTSPYPAMVTQNILTPVVERTTTIGTSSESIKTNYFNPSGSIFVPQTVQQTVGTSATNTRLTYNSYDNNGNVTQYIGADGIVTCLLWDATKTYLMAKVDGATFSTISAQNGKVCNYNSKTLWTSLTGLAPNALVTTYSYSALVGIASQTATNGTTTKYLYDTFGRLSEVKNDDEKLLKKHKYRYASN